jgi:hypothetical protein
VLSSLLSSLLFGPQAPDDRRFRILFLGNSHTASNGLIGTVEGLLESGGAHVDVAIVTGGHLDDIEDSGAADDEFADEKWTHVVLQGAMISSSHKYEYPQNKAIALARRAKRAGAVPLYFSEWPRKGWDESDYIFGHYEAIRKAAGGENVPVCYAWDAALKSDPGLQPWAADGNHASPLGTYLAAATIALWIAGPERQLWFVPGAVERSQAREALKHARETVRVWRQKAK